MKSMIRRFWLKPLVLVFLIPFSLIYFSISSDCQGNSSDLNRSIRHIETFTRLYGYVRFFYPGDEAAAMDWDGLAIYGVKQVKNTRDPVELKKVLEELFLPIAPGLIIHETGSKVNFSLESITPPGAGEMKVVCWQHYGVGLNITGSIYKSIRLNRKNLFPVPSQGFGTITKGLDAEPYRGKPIKLKAAVKVNTGKGQLWLRVDRQGGNIGFFDNMGNRPISSNQWNYYEITGTIDADAQQLFYGCLLAGPGQIFTDDFQIYIKEDNREESWKPIVIANPGFEEDKEAAAPGGWGGGGAGYSIKVTSETAAKGSKSLSIQSQTVALSQGLFPQKPSIGTTISKELGSGLSCVMPIALYGTESQTFPAAPQDRLNQLKAAIDKNTAGKFPGDDPDVRLADIVISWNIFQHFYPYFDVVKTDWKAALTQALTDAYKDKNQRDFLKTLQKFTAKLKDGHVRVTLQGDTSESYRLPLSWDWIENQLVITDIYDDSLSHIRVGDVVAKINGITAQEALEQAEQYISAATPGWKRFRSLNSLPAGEKNQEFLLDLKRDGNTYRETLRASLSPQDYYNLYNKKAIKSKKLEDGIFYLDLDQVSMEEILALMPGLQKAKAIICDLRGYPNGNHPLINYLLKEKDTAQWMWVPQVIYPDFEQVTYEKIGWNMVPLEPTLSAKMVFITDGRAISYSESYMGYIEGYKLATIVGQPTAGTNGNVNTFSLPGGYDLRFTGMRVVKIDGSQHHGVGIIPDVRVERTIKGVKAGRDEFLEKALEIAR